MRKMLMILMLMIVGTLSLTSCSNPGVDAGEEMVLIQKPWIFGSGGVVETPVENGRKLLALSTDYERYNMQPIKFTEKFDDVITFDNNPVDFIGYIQIQILKGKSPFLHDNFGKNWYTNNINEQFRANIRNKCGKFKMFTLSTNRTIVDSLENQILKEMRAYAKELNIPIDIKQVIIGKVTPPESVLIETEKTAAEIQKVKTQEARDFAEIARMKADVSKAKADMAYMNTFTGMSVNQYLQLRQLEIEKEKIEMVKGKKNVTINMVSGGSAIPTIPLR